MSNFYLKKPASFEIACEVSTLFMEYEEKLLVLLRSSDELSPNTWGIPGGKLEDNETPLEALVREIKEELDLTIDPLHVDYKLSVFVDHPKIAYQLHLYQYKLDHLPNIKLNPLEHIDYKWQPIKAFNKIPLLDGQLEAFHLVYPPYEEK